MDELKGGKGKKGDEALLAQAKTRFKQCVDDYEEERKKQLEDLIFCELDQWPEEIRAARENDINGARPCLTLDKISQYILQVTNDLRKNRPAVKVRPVDDFSDVKTAEVLQGVIRRIEDISAADVAYLTAGESAVKIGEGYFRFVTDFEDENSFNQEILIKPVDDTFSVYLGPHKMPDGSDAEYGFILEDMPRERFKREFPKAKSDKQDFTNGMGTADLKYWTSNENVRVCEYFYFDFEQKDLYLLEDGSAILKDDYENQGLTLGIVNSRKTSVKKVKWCKLTGLEILEKQEWAGKYIPIVKVEGRASTVKGKRRLKGLVRSAKDSLRAYNYWMSTLTEKMALAPKTPFIGAEGQFEGHEHKWARANTANFPYLEYKPTTVDGHLAPPPQRQGATPIEAAMIQQLSVIEHDIQTSLGMFKASVGQADPQQSGRALMALQSQTDTGTFHFPDNVAISIRHGGRILIDLIPKIYDTPRIVRIMGEDGAVSSAQIDPSQPEAMSQRQGLFGEIQTIYNLGVGKYDVTATVGPSYATKRMEQSEMMMQILQAQPEMMATIGDLLFKSFDWPMADKIAKRLQKTLPPQLQDAEDGQEIPPQVQAAIQQIEQQNQMLDQKAQALSQAEREIEQKAMETQRKAVEVFVKEQQLQTEAAKIELEKYAQELSAREASTPEQIDVWKAELDAKTKVEIANIKRETDLALAMLNKEGVDSLEDVQDELNNAEMTAIVDGLNANIAALMQAQQQLMETLGQSHMALMQTNTQNSQALLDALNKPKVTEAKAVKQKDGSWKLIKKEV